MEDGLVPCYYKSERTIVRNVLILVVVEDGLVHDTAVAPAE